VLARFAEPIFAPCVNTSPMRLLAMSKPSVTE
jgi:hypothetical protein